MIIYTELTSVTKLLRSFLPVRENIYNLFLHFSKISHDLTVVCKLKVMVMGDEAPARAMQ